MKGKSMAINLKIMALAMGLSLVAGLSFAEQADDVAAPPVVAGPIQAVERERSSIIVDGRRFELAREVSFDGLDVSAERALGMLSEGDEITLLDVESSYDQVTRIRTRMR